ncbi:MAG: hypothetical protein UEA60_09935 [Lachnospiraceae bacterium]|nr:hypothetical protein [Lachnospiraceae bacterium]
MSKQLDLKALLESKMGNIEPQEGSKIAIETANLSVPHNLMFDAKSTEFEPETKPVTASGARGLTVEEAKIFDDEMNRFIDTVLIAGVDYGIIPHCSKPSLLKSGAEKILNYLGLIARTDITNRVEDYNVGFFSYECKVYLIDYNGVVKGEGVGITNTREGKYAKSNGYSVQNVVLKMAKKRALVDAALNVGNLSARFTQDVEDMNIEADSVGGKSPEELKPKASASKPATKKQIAFLEKLMQEAGSSPEAMNRYVQKNYDIEDYHKANSLIVSELIEKFQSAKQQ